ASLLSLLTDIGFLTFALREISRDKSKTKKYLDNIMALRLFLTIVVFLIALVIILLLNKSVEAKISTLIITFALFIMLYGTNFTFFFRAHEKLEYESLARIIERVITFALGLYVLSKGYSIVIFALVFAVSHISYLIFLHILFNKKITKIGFEIDLSFWWHLIKKGIPFWFSVVFTIIYFRIDIVMLSLMKDFSIVGWYSASQKFVSTLNFIPILLMAAIFSPMSRFYHENKGFLRLLLEKAFKYLLIIILPICIGTTMLAKRIILFIYGEGFSNSVLILKILIWIELFIFLNYLFGQFLNAINKEKLFTYTTGIIVLVNIILNFILIPSLEHIGAAIASLISAFINFILLYTILRKNNYRLKLFKTSIKPILASLSMALFIYTMSGLHLFLLITFSAAIYFLILFILKAIGKEELDLVKSLFKKRPDDDTSSLTK
ncbi:MAG: polysaccharide biosynthesis C-terminal domain-containing protein, partial [Candidatus Woesearchaeota archaeon]|nr:polysaccharide biosynthesis C-terminal domain-containing protein [Candidatus Woesearchaeota archaeon]